MGVKCSRYEMGKANETWIESLNGRNYLGDPGIKMGKILNWKIKTFGYNGVPSIHANKIILPR
jgi:hypothetical protein